MREDNRQHITWLMDRITTNPNAKDTTLVEIVLEVGKLVNGCLPAGCELEGFARLETELCDTLNYIEREGIL